MNGRSLNPSRVSQARGRLVLPAQPDAAKARFSPMQIRAFHQLWKRLHMAAAAYDGGVINAEQFGDIVDHVHATVPCSACASAFETEKEQLKAAAAGHTSATLHLIHDAASRRARPSHRSPTAETAQAAAAKGLAVLVFTALRRTG